MEKDVMRVRVVCAADDAVECRAADGTCVRLSYVTGPADSPYDSSYLRPLLHPGMKLNLVDARCDDVLHARFIVAEPDYLVNATAVAGCMAEYGDGALVWLMRKLGAAPNSEALQMGNFAGRLLDEALHGESRTKPYAESARDFFRGAATSIMALGRGFDSRAFHAEAMRQRSNLVRAVESVLPRVSPGFRAADAIVEPTFFCEVLGLQGRMDCLLPDGSVVVEQKSGKAAMGSRGVETPLLRREHYAQLLLYRAALRYGHPGAEAEAYLLYSKYYHSVVDAGASEPLLQHAMALRNRLALAEIDYGRNGFGVLENLTPESLNTRGSTGALWTRYQRPQLAARLDPLHKADAAARAYFMRMMRFVAREHVLAKLGNGSGDGTGFASAWLCTAAEKREAGSLLDRLRLLSPADGHSGTVSDIVLSVPDDGGGDAANFRVADIVLLYSYGDDAEPDLRAALPLRCTVRAMEEGRIHLQLRTPQSDARVLLRDAGRRWAVEHDFIEAGADAQYRGLHALLCAPRRRLDVLLGRRVPEADASRTLRGSYGDFDDTVRRAMQARDLFLVVGPPGTGKTSHGLVGILGEELLDPCTSVLLTAYTNRAVDEICARLEACGTDYVRLGSASACAPFCRRRTVDALVEAAPSLAEVREHLLSVRVVVATTAALNTRIELLSLRRFSLAIVDEASQILEPQLAGVFAAMCGDVPAVERFVLIGDHRQLPAVVRQDASESRIDDARLRGLGFSDCRMSLFERMLRRYHGDASVVGELTRQGRMHAEIADFPSRMFYGGRLLPVPLPHQLAPSCARRVSFVAVEPAAGDVSDKVNSAEAAVIAGVVARVVDEAGESFDPDMTVGVIVPYRAQIATVRAALVARGITAPVAVDTVERYQGSQREHIVYGFTVRHPAQLAFLADSTIRDTDGAVVDRRLNVALTRAREYLTMVGNPAVLRHNALFAALIDHCGGSYS
ncbi:MAG: AAA family ATPase [Muribaculaceae bacterium]|nr:AAA family ATPase [Muribaculaceae bacterium]